MKYFLYVNERTMEKKINFHLLCNGNEHIFNWKIPMTYHPTNNEYDGVSIPVDGFVVHGLFYLDHTKERK